LDDRCRSYVSLFAVIGAVRGSVAAVCAYGRAAERPLERGGKRVSGVRVEWRRVVSTSEALERGRSTDPSKSGRRMVLGMRRWKAAATPGGVLALVGYLTQAIR
jgi:hypothetical protein